MENIQDKLWDKVENSNTKIAKRVYNALNKDILYVVQDGNVFWFEQICEPIPNFVYHYAKAFYKKLGLAYLYDIN